MTFEVKSIFDSMTKEEMAEEIDRLRNELEQAGDPDNGDYDEGWDDAMEHASDVIDDIMQANRFSKERP